ncbi:MAG: HAMP domain-containing histidine kinase [Deltaproteobacteria bacterium]|nr:HAMP domain-containing histidine kinase [Deltaproteobacteria bacterium]MBW2519673.1 HAMP domain-containing histidine kinase [Deltaproteobacteria bacterium]
MTVNLKDKDIQNKPVFGLHTKPLILFLISVSIIFVTELFIMLLIPHLHEVGHLEEAIVDSVLLSMFIIPSLYLLFYKPLRDNLLSLEQSEHREKQLNELDRMKNDFISTAAHELNTPVCVIMGYAELMLSSSDLDKKQHREFLEIIYKKSLTLERITEDLLDLSLMQTGRQLRLVLEPNDIKATIEDVVHFYQAKYPKRQILIEVKDHLPLLYYDNIRISQVFDNLLSNALKYSPESSPIVMRAQLHQEWVLVQVIDQGIGMTPEQVSQAFDKFYRADMSDTSVSGIGLGMAIVKNIITRHGGRIWIESEPNDGTTVSLILPLTPHVEAT